MNIHWKIKRIDEGDNPDPRNPGCLLEIEGRIEVEGKPAGLLEANYILDIDPSSSGAFFELWDADSWTCSVYEEMMEPNREHFRQPLPRLLEECPGMLIIAYISLRPEYRGIGLGREVVRQFVRCCADDNTGAVLLNADPLQHRDGAYDSFDDEVRDLPWNGKEKDTEHLRSHLRSWGLHHMPKTRFMVAGPGVLSERHAAKWPPSPILDNWNTCVCCNGWIDLQTGEWEQTDEGPVHSKCG